MKLMLRGEGSRIAEIIIQLIKALPKKEQEDMKYIMIQWIAEGQGWA